MWSIPGQGAHVSKRGCDARRGEKEEEGRELQPYGTFCDELEGQRAMSGRPGRGGCHSPGNPHATPGSSDWYGRLASMREKETVSE